VQDGDVPERWPIATAHPLGGRSVLGGRIKDVNPRCYDGAHSVGMSTSTRSQTVPPRRYETLVAAAQRTGMSTRTLRRRIADGSLPAYRTGRRIIRVCPDDVDRLLERIPSGAV
jgi:excisionase family DNA binding protein